MSDERGIALVCESGHLLTGDIQESPGKVSKYCDRCGSPAFHACQECNTAVPGDHWVAPRDHHPFVSWSRRPIYTPPAYCSDCGAEYPWTTYALQAAQELVEEFQLDAEEMEALKNSLPDLVRDTPKTQAASLRLKRLLGKAGEEAGAMLRGVLVNVVSETVRRGVWGS